MAASINPVLYVDVFNTPYPTTQQEQQFADYVSDLTGSGFQTVILASLHIDPYGNLHFGNPNLPGGPLIVDGQLQPGFAFLPELIQSLTATGSSIENVFFCLGGWGTEADYIRAGQLMTQYPGAGNPLARNFVALQAIGADGIDFDLEAGGGPAAYAYPLGVFQQTVVQLTTMLRTLHLDVTYCPYGDQQFWMNCLTIGNMLGFTLGNPVSWLNLQCYSGGTGNTQKQWTGYVKGAANSGITSPSAFVVPGFGPSTCPKDLQATLSNLSFMTKGAAGAFVYTYSGILQNQQNGTCGPNNTTADYANAIINGITALNGTS